MPQQQALPTWLALNNVNSASQSGQTDPVTNFPYAGGGLNAGDYFDVTNDEALSASYTTNGILYSGRYRYVQVDSGATSSNVKTGTVGYLRAGTSVKSAITTAVGSGMTNGTYTVTGTTATGGGSGAILQIVVAGGAISGNPTVIAGGINYVSPPSFSLTALGGSGGSVVAQLGTSMNIVTSADVALSGNVALAGVGSVRPVVFLNSITPGNYGFIQELGVATVLCGSTNTQQANYFAIVTSGGSANGTLAASSQTYGPYAIGNVLDPVTSPLANTPIKVLLDGPTVQD
jgi:hypothetical protein